MDEQYDPSEDLSGGRPVVVRLAVDRKWQIGRDLKFGKLDRAAAAAAAAASVRRCKLTSHRLDHSFKETVVQLVDSTLLSRRWFQISTCTPTPRPHPSAATMMFRGLMRKRARKVAVLPK